MEYYKKVLEIKVDLHITELNRNSLDGYEIEGKPLLLFGDCSMEWFNSNAERLNEKIKDFACAVFYYGNTNSSLNIKQKQDKVRKIFSTFENTN
jgi:hypothetical protein